ncbi:diguanylate cyclase [bacterium]|nr:diguanylate cyclase [bacterium]
MSESPARVLCIDDDPDMRLPLAEALSEQGFDVRSAPDGAGGIDAFLDGGADVVLLDLALPDMDGVAVMKALKTLAADAFLPVIFLTARTDNETKVEALEKGGDDFCGKPCSLEELTARIHAALRKRDRELKLESESGRFRRLALVDALTSLGNRRAFETDLDREWARMARSGAPLALLVAEIDHWKLFNERHGRAVGDRVLRDVATAIEKTLRQTDRAFRYGGEEFAALLPDATREGARRAAERVREGVAALRSLPITISIGLAVAPDAALATSAELVGASHAALSDAKASGRDRVVTWSARIAR